MIVKGGIASSAFLKTAIVLLCSIGGAFSLWYFLPHLNSWKKEGVVFCDAEVTRGKNFISHGDYFFNAETQTDEAAFEGNFSSKINTGEGFQFGFGLEWKDFEAGKTYEASVWRRKENHSGKSDLVILDENRIIDIAVSESSREKNSWEFLKIKFTIPFQQDISKLRIYVRSDGKGIFYFDDLKIIEKEIPVTTHLHSFQREVIELNISEKEFRKINQKRKKALQIGVLQSDENDWVSGSLTSTESAEVMPIEMRLKGDWLDHLKNNKWSFRVKVKDPFAWRKMKTFSLQSPETREFLNEWVLHQWWKKEDVLTPRYDFVELKLNDKSLGVYAYEEHFEKQLPESNQRREGVIVRFSEEGFWEDVKVRISDLEGNPIAHVNNAAKYQTADVRPFKENQILQNPILKQQLETAQNLMMDYLEQKRSPSEIFDTERMAKYFAICDLMQAQHSVVWHNMRFYYNPVLNKLEPIGFDGFPTYEYPFLLMSEGALSHHFKENDDPIQFFFSDTVFLKQYIYNLFHFSKKEYLEAFLEELDDGISARTNFITKEFQNYKSNKSLVEKRVSGIRSNIFPFNDLTLKAYSQKNRKGEKIVQVGNTHSLPVKVIGTGFSKNQLDLRLENPITLPAYITTPFYKDQSKKRKKEAPDVPSIIRQSIEYQGIRTNNNSKYVFYKVLGQDSIFHSSIKNWNFPQPTIPTFRGLEKTVIATNNLYSVQEKKVIFHSGKYIVTNDIIIPKGYKVYFTEGTEIDFTKGARFLSYSPIQMHGTADSPIKIFSSDASANGFTILQTEAPSELEFVIFENLNTHRKENWNLTGAVTFYESEVNIMDCIFTKNKCEDGLNLIRSNFTIHRSTFSQTFSDGLDLDFCNGSINHSNFLNTTNDGLDISGSNVYVVECKMDNCGDKGISVGEESKAVILDAIIKNSPIGIASKDLSDVMIENVDLTNCGQGFTAFQKKAEYGGSKIEVKNYTAENVKRLHNIRAGCTLKLQGKIIKN